MAKPLKFVRLETSLKGLMTRAIKEFDRYLEDDPRSYHWVCIEHPESMAKTLEVLADDLPEEDLAQVVPRLPYLILLFHNSEDPPTIPVEATLAFLSVLNRQKLVTILRQCSDRERLGPFFGLDATQWTPVFFLLGGVPDLDAEFAPETPANCTYI